MKIIEAMKSVKKLLVKADDLRQKITKHSAYLSIETPVYKDQPQQVSSWIHAHEDIMQEIGALQVRLAKTNLATRVEINLGDKAVTKCITEWIYRRGHGKSKDGTASLDAKAWQALTDRGLREGNVPSSAGGDATKVSIVRCYDPAFRDQKLSVYNTEPNRIDAALEVTNATTDLLD